MNRTAALALALLLSVGSLPVVSAQEPTGPIEDAFTAGALQFDLEVIGSDVLNFDRVPNKGAIQVRISDTSRDTFPPPETGQGGTAPQNHYYTITATSVVEDGGWKVDPFPPIVLKPGDEFVFDVRAQVTGQATHPDYPIVLNVTATPQYCCGSESQELNVMFRTTGILPFYAKATPAVQEVSPDDIANFDILVENKGLQHRSFTMDVLSNPCNLQVVKNSGVLPGLTSDTYPITVQAPSDKAFYFSENCNLQVVVQFDDGQSFTVSMAVKVNGTFIDPGWIINIVIALVIIGGIFWFLLAARRRTEEEILGKPQPPWTLPAEQIYLAELEKKDPQAAYVVRHFLMEDEYKTSLLWYHAYKKATKGRRAMERRVLKMEHDFEKWDLKAQETLSAGDDKADKQIDKLQAKLDKKTSKAHHKDHKAWQKQVAKLETKAANDHNKALGEWKKAAKKAKKAGQPEPKKPVMPAIEFPEEPQEERVLLDDHKWASKKERILASADKADEKAEAKYQKERAKRLAKMRKKMAKLADKIDDPDFVEEHPLLQGASTA